MTFICKGSSGESTVDITTPVEISSFTLKGGAQYTVSRCVQIWPSNNRKK